MTKTMIPSLDGRLFDAVTEEATENPPDKWSEDDQKILLDTYHKMRQSTNKERLRLEEMLAGGVEPRSFYRDFSPLLPPIQKYLARINTLVEQGLAAEDIPSEILEESRLVQQELQLYHDLLDEALSQASKPSRPIDWERVRASEGTYARGETKPFSKP